MITIFFHHTHRFLTLAGEYLHTRSELRNLSRAYDYPIRVRPVSCLRSDSISALAYFLWICPSLRGCGHTYCFQCLRYYFADRVAQQANCGNNRHRIPRRLRQFDPAKVTTGHLRRLRKLLPLSQYTCPLCRTSISSRDHPIVVPALQNLVTAVAEATRTLSSDEEDHPIITAFRGTWEGLFTVCS